MEVRTCAVMRFSSTVFLEKITAMPKSARTMRFGGSVDEPSVVDGPTVKGTDLRSDTSHVIWPVVVRCNACECELVGRFCIQLAHTAKSDIC